MTNEMRKNIWDMMDSEDYNPDTACEKCPYCDRCKSEELFYGCGVWEDQMGADL